MTVLAVDSTMLLVEDAGDLSLFIPQASISSIAPLLAAMLAIVCTLAAACFIVAWREEKNIRVRLLGSLMVLCLALASNNSFVYFFALVVIATLITELDFLERVVALFWGRDKYWDWKIQSLSASEVAEKVAAEVIDDLDVASGETGIHEMSASFTTTDRVIEALAFEKAVQRALISGKGPFLARKVTTNRKIVSSTGKHAELDAIVVTRDANFVVEIRHSARPSILPNALAALRRAVAAYGEYLSRRGIRKKIVPVAVVPSTLEIPSTFRGALVLRFDLKSSRFVNEAEFLKAYDHWDGRHDSFTPSA